MLVAEAGAEVEEMRKELRATMGGGEAEHKSYTSANGYGNSALPSPSAFDPDSPDDDAYGAFEQQRQAEIMHEQDEAIDGVFKTVGNLRQQADDMGRELEEQVELLEDANQITDRVQGKIQNGIRKVGWVIKNTEGVYSTYCSKCPKAGEKVLAYRDYRNLVKLLHWRACLRVDTTTHPRLDSLMLRLQRKAAFGIWLHEFVYIRSTTALHLDLECRLFILIYTGAPSGSPGICSNHFVVHTFLVAPNPSKCLLTPDPQKKTRRKQRAQAT